MTDSVISESGVRHELLRLALINSARSVALQVISVVVIASMGLHANRPVAAAAVTMIGVAVAVWRLLISRRFAQERVGLMRLQQELEGNAALSGALWAVATLFIYPALHGTLGTTYVGMVFGSITVAAFFMTLVGRSFPILSSIQLGALIAVSLGSEVVRSLVAVENEIAGIKVRGFVAPPHFTKPTRAMQLIYVNGRPVKNRTLMAALRNIRASWLQLLLNPIFRE